MMELNEDNVRVVLNDGSSMGRKLYGSIEIAVEKEEDFNRDESKADKVRKTTEKVKSQIIRDQQIVKNMIRMLEKEKYDKAHDFGYGEYSDTLIHSLEKLLGIWTDKHTKIVEESEEKFKTHTEGEEVDI